MAIKDRLNHWINQEILDCLDIIEDRKQTTAEMSEYGEIKQYREGDREFYWKGKLMILFPRPSVDSMSMLDVEAIHLYDGGKNSSLSKYNEE